MKTLLLIYGTLFNFILTLGIFFFASSKPSRNTKKPFPLSASHTRNHHRPPATTIVVGFPQTHPASSPHYSFSLSHPHSHTSHHHPRQSASHTKQLQRCVPARCHLIPSLSQQHFRSVVAVFKLPAVSAVVTGSLPFPFLFVSASLSSSEETHMSHVTGFMEGESDYGNLKGDTGPLVCPADLLCNYSACQYLTAG
ncbi:hypothetical protein PIB30_091276 [Stylosanthes scabra]|uniref:Uncharacterized protein n=1 Tax=Stylosanthes scabra TaxID=79078 RepID=A0ABU6TTY2_9FABA|nr:hypothetical protein [Stylosanthes scabra]